MPPLKPRIRSIDDLLGVTETSSSKNESKASNQSVCDASNEIQMLHHKSFAVFEDLHSENTVENDLMIWWTVFHNMVFWCLLLSERLSQMRMDLNMRCWQADTGREPLLLQTANFPVSSRKISPMRMLGFM